MVTIPSLRTILRALKLGKKNHLKKGAKLGKKSANLEASRHQGSTFGICEYLYQSNDNADFVKENKRFKFVDDLTFLEIINLLNIGLATHNVRQQVPSDISTHNQLIRSDHLKSQNHLKAINNWTKKKKMKLNIKKTKNMIFNFTKKYQFTTKLTGNQEPIAIVKETKLSGTYITDDLKWDRDTEEIVKSAMKRMQLLFKTASFTSNVNDLKNIYFTFIRSILEKSAVVWHSSLSKKNRLTLERVQKAAIKIILKNRYTNYEKGLELLRMESLDERRRHLCLKFAKNCLKNDKLNGMFNKRKDMHKMKKRNRKEYEEKMSKTKRYKKSAIPYLTNLLNAEKEEQKQILMG